MFVPVTNEAASEVMNLTSAAISPIEPKRRIGTLCCSVRATLYPTCALGADSNGPGQTCGGREREGGQQQLQWFGGWLIVLQRKESSQEKRTELTVIPLSATSRASERVSWHSAPFEAQYGVQ